MNINDYRRAMDQIVPGTELKERIMNRTQKRHIPIRRVLTAALAAVLTVACLFTVALAASPELRTAVLSFFRMEQREQVPNSSAGQNGFDISQAEIGALVKAQYIKMDRHYGMSGDLLTDLTWSDDYRTLLDAKFWEVRENELIPVDAGMVTTKVDITFNEERYRGELYWFIRDGELAVLKGDPIGADTRPEDQWYVDTIPGHTDTVMLRLYEGRQSDYTEYPILYHLDTGEVEDILAGTGAEALEYAYSYEWSEDFRRAIIQCGSQLEQWQQTWFCDLDTKTLSKLEDLVQVEAEYAGFADNDTLILSAYGENEAGWQDVTCWAYNISTGQAVKTLDHAPYYRRQDDNPSGAMLYGRCCVLISEDGQAQIIDLKTGDRTILEGFIFQKGNHFMPNSSGNKLLYSAMNPGLEGLGISQIGVVDLEKGTFIAFDREGYENLYEGGIGWSDDNTVSIHASTLDNETQYLLLYQF